MKNLLFSIVFAFVATFVTAQDCGYSLFNLIAERMNVPATELTVSEFRTEATKLGASVGITYDKSGRNNVAIIKAVCAELSSTEDATNAIIADWARMTGVDVTSMKEVVNVYTHKNNSELYTTTVYADGTTSVDTFYITVVPQVNADTVVNVASAMNSAIDQVFNVTSDTVSIDTTVLDYEDYSVFLANKVPYDTVWHYEDTCSNIVDIVSDSSSSDSKRITIWSDLGHHPEGSTLLEVYYFTRKTRRDQIGFRNMWYDFVRSMKAQGIEPWGDIAEPYREHCANLKPKARLRAEWRWLSYYAGDWKAWVQEHGDDITILQETKYNKVVRNKEHEFKSSIIQTVKN